MKYCVNCGFELEENQAVCLNCGKLVEEKNKTKDSSMTFAIIGIVGGLLIPLLGWIFGGMGISKANENKNDTARILSILAIVIGTIMFVVNLALLY